jgi:excisionase family DNA binding protein
MRRLGFEPKSPPGDGARPHPPGTRSSDAAKSHEPTGQPDPTLRTRIGCHQAAGDWPHRSLRRWRQMAAFGIHRPRSNSWFGDANDRRHQHSALVVAGQATTPDRQITERHDRLDRSRFLASRSANDRQRRTEGLGVRERTGIFNNRGRAMEDRLLYRVPEVAVILNISRSKVYELFSSGDLGSVKIDRIRLVRSSDLRAYVDGLHPVDTPDRCLASG